MCLEVKGFKLKRGLDVTIEELKKAIRRKILRRASEPITVYKILMAYVNIEGKILYASPYLKCEYKPGVFRSNLKIHGGISTVGNWLGIEQGIHAFTSEDAIYDFIMASTRMIVKMTIPAGAIYSISGDGREIVSTRMEWDGTIVRKATRELVLHKVSLINKFENWNK